MSLSLSLSLCVFCVSRTTKKRELFCFEKKRKHEKTIEREIFFFRFFFWGGSFFCPPVCFFVLLCFVFNITFFFHNTKKSGKKREREREREREESSLKRHTYIGRRRSKRSLLPFLQVKVPLRKTRRKEGRVDVFFSSIFRL